MNVFRTVLLLQEEQTVELKKDKEVEKPVQIVVKTALNDIIPEEEEEKEEEEEEDEDDDEFAFEKFSAMHFQRSATHTHIQQRLRQPLLYHEDEGDTLVSATLFFFSFCHYSPILFL